MKTRVMNKTIVCPGIVVYHNALEAFNDVMNLHKEADVILEKKYNLDPSRQWLMYGSITNLDGPWIPENDDEDLIKQSKTIKEIFKTYNTVIKDYLKNHSKAEYLPDFIKSLDTDSWPWFYGGLTLLKYDVKTKEYYENKAAITHNRTMGYHTDRNNYDIDSRGPKLIITVTMYLNDDYEGGEICFFDSNSGNQYSYKPKAGDVTVFPSGEPYFHSVLPSYRSERYLARLFLMYHYTGSEEWLKNEKKIGKEKWESMEKERLKEVWNSGSSQTIVVFPGEDDPEGYDTNKRIIRLKSEPIKVVASIDQNLG
jgi:hypothetical protein